MTDAIPLKLGNLWISRCNPCRWERLAVTGPREATRHANDHNTKHHTKENTK